MRARPVLALTAKVVEEDEGGRREEAKSVRERD